MGRLARRRADDEGTIAVMAAVIIPVLLLVVALALTTLVWGASETEVQRASDQAALAAASSEVLVPDVGLTTPVLPTLTSVAPGITGLLTGATTALSNLSTSACTNVGNAYAAASPLLNAGNPLLTAALSALGVGTVTSLNNALAQLTATSPTLAAALQQSLTTPCSPITVVPTTPSIAQTSACASVAQSMQSNQAPYSNNFFGGTGGSIPDCTTNKRVTVNEASGSSLLSFNGGSSISVGDTSVNYPAGTQLIQNTIAGLGVHLGDVIPNTICPEVSVGIDQPVKGVVFSRVGVPNGRSTAKRLIKNAVVVPVFNGVSLSSPVGTGSVSTTPINLNSTVLDPLQKQLITALNAINDQINTLVNNAAPVTNAVNSTLNALSGLPGGSANVTVKSPNLLQCVSQTVASLYNPPTGTGTTTTVQQVLANAAASGDPVQIIQVGVQPCVGAKNALEIYSCLLPAIAGTGSSLAQSLTGLYDVPVLDVTPVIVKQVGTDPTNFQATAVDATKAVGAFRSVLVRSPSDSRYVP